MKNSVQSISADISIVLMCLGILVSCPLRIFQMLKNMDPATGFYLDYNNIMIIILYAVLAIVSVLILVLTYLSARIPAAVAPKGRHIPLAVASFIFSATLFYDALSTYFVKSQTTATIIQNMQSLSSIHHFRSATALLSSMYFIVVFISYISGNEYSKKMKLFSLAPIVWTIARVLERITVIISIVRVSELLLELCAFIFMMLFFMSFARVASDVNCNGSMWSLIGCGSVSVLFIMTYAIPRLILVVTGNTESLINGYPLSYSDLGCVLFILAFVVTTLRSGYTVADIKKMNEEIKAEQSKEEKIQQAVTNVQTMAETSLSADDGDVRIAKASAPEEAAEQTEKSDTEGE